MKITRKSEFTGIERTLDINVTEEQLLAWEQGTNIQDAMPNLTDDEREFIKSGITAEEWDELFDEGNDENILDSPNGKDYDDFLRNEQQRDLENGEEEVAF